MYLNDVEDTLNLLMHRAEVERLHAAYKASKAAPPAPGTFDASPACQHVRSILGDPLYDDPWSVRVGIGLDWVDLGGTSVGVIGLQVLDVPDAHRGKSDTWAILGVIMGGDKPTSMDGYLMPIFQDLQAALGDDPRGHMFLRYQGPNDGRPHAEPRLIPILISLFADTPA
ncbi:hypothetical protein HaLaN_29584, partial [Haematococcus lacustris]